MGKPTVIRPCVSAYVVLDGIPAVAAVAYTFLSLHGAKGTWPVVAMAIGVAVVFHFWVASHQIVLFDDSIQYRSVMRTWQVKYSDVTRLEMRVGWDAYRDRFSGMPFMGLVVHSEEEPGRTPLTINPKLFSLADLHLVRETIARKGKGATGGYP